MADPPWFRGRAGDWDLRRRVLASGARTADTGDATVLHFRATGGEQVWPDRVIQNTRWLERISIPAQLSDVRNGVRRIRAEREALLTEAVATLEFRLAYVEGTRWWRLGEKLRPAWRALRRV